LIQNAWQPGRYANAKYQNLWTVGSGDLQLVGKTTFISQVRQEASWLVETLQIPCKHPCHLLEKLAGRLALGLRTQLMFTLP
jgi:hypothetical protein